MDSKLKEIFYNFMVKTAEKQITVGEAIMIWTLIEGKRAKIVALRNGFDGSIYTIDQIALRLKMDVERVKKLEQQTYQMIRYTAQSLVPEEEKYEVIEAMECYGGSFVKQLAGCFRTADMDNFRKLKIAFAGYWKQYRDMAKEKK